MKHRRERVREVHVDGKHVTFGQSHRSCQWVIYWDSGIIWLLVFFPWNNRCVLSALIIPFMYKFSDFTRMSYPDVMLFRKVSLCGIMSSCIHPFTYLHPLHGTGNSIQTYYSQEVQTLLPLCQSCPGSGEGADANCSVCQVNRNSKRINDSVWPSNHH